MEKRSLGRSTITKINYKKRFFLLMPNYLKYCAGTPEVKQKTFQKVLEFLKNFLPISNLLWNQLKSAELEFVKKVAACLRKTISIFLIPTFALVIV